MHRYGTPAHRLEGALSSVSERLGINAEFFSMPTSIIASFKEDKDESTYVQRVYPGALHLEKLCSIDSIGEDVASGKLNYLDGAQEIEKILAKKERYGTLARILAYMITSAMLVFYLKGSLLDFYFTLCSGLIIGSLFQIKKRIQINEIFEVLSSALVSFSAGIYLHYFPTASIEVLIICPLIVLLPGLEITVAVQELSTQNLTSGTARLMGGVMTLLKLAFGALMGMKFSSLIFPWNINHASYELPLWINYIILPIYALGFTITTRAHIRDYKIILFALFCGLTCNQVGTYIFGNQLLNIGSEASLFVGGVLISSIANIFARRANRPSILILVPGIILLVPGIVGLKGVSHIFQHDLLVGLDSMFSMVANSLSIVVGIFTGNCFVRPRTHL